MRYHNENTPQEHPTNNLDVTQISDTDMAQYAYQFNKIEPSLGVYNAEIVDFSQFELYNMLNMLADMTVLSLSLSILVLCVPSFRSFVSKKLSVGSLLLRR